MNTERAILLVLLAARGDALDTAAIRRELPGFTREDAPLAEIENTLRALEEKKEIQGVLGDREDAQGNPVVVFSLLQKGRSRALK